MFSKFSVLPTVSRYLKGSRRLLHMSKKIAGANGIHFQNSYSSCALSNEDDQPIYSGARYSLSAVQKRLMSSRDSKDGDSEKSNDKANEFMTPNKKDTKSGGSKVVKRVIRRKSRKESRESLKKGDRYKFSSRRGLNPRQQVADLLNKQDEHKGLDTLKNIGISQSSLTPKQLHVEYIESINLKDIELKKKPSSSIGENLNLNPTTRGIEKSLKLASETIQLTNRSLELKIQVPIQIKKENQTQSSPTKKEIDEPNFRVILNLDSISPSENPSNSKPTGSNTHINEKEDTTLARMDVNISGLNDSKTAPKDAQMKTPVIVKTFKKEIQNMPINAGNQFVNAQKTEDTKHNMKGVDKYKPIGLRYIKYSKLMDRVSTLNVKKPKIEIVKINEEIKPSNALLSSTPSSDIESEKLPHPVIQEVKNPRHLKSSPILEKHSNMDIFKLPETYKSTNFENTTDSKIQIKNDTHPAAQEIQKTSSSQSNKSTSQEKSVKEEKKFSEIFKLNNSMETFEFVGGEEKDINEVKSKSTSNYLENVKSKELNRKTTETPLIQNHKFNGKDNEIKSDASPLPPSITTSSDKSTADQSIRDIKADSSKSLNQRKIVKSVEKKLQIPATPTYTNELNRKTTQTPLKQNHKFDWKDNKLESSPLPPPITTSNELNRKSTQTPLNQNHKFDWKDNKLESSPLPPPITNSSVKSTTEQNIMDIKAASSKSLNHVVKSVEKKLEIPATPTYTNVKGKIEQENNELRLKSTNATLAESLPYSTTISERTVDNTKSDVFNFKNKSIHSKHSAHEKSKMIKPKFISKYKRAEMFKKATKSILGRIDSGKSKFKQKAEKVNDMKNSAFENLTARQELYAVQKSRESNPQTPKDGETYNATGNFDPYKKEPKTPSATSGKDNLLIKLVPQSSNASIQNHKVVEIQKSKENLNSANLVSSSGEKDSTPNINNHKTEQNTPSATIDEVTHFANIQNLKPVEGKKSNDNLNLKTLALGSGEKDSSPIIETLKSEAKTTSATSGEHKILPKIVPQSITNTTIQNSNVVEIKNSNANLNSNKLDLGSSEKEKVSKTGTPQTEPKTSGENKVLPKLDTDILNAKKIPKALETDSKIVKAKGSAADVENSNLKRLKVANTKVESTGAKLKTFSKSDEITFNTTNITSKPNLSATMSQPHAEVSKGPQKTDKVNNIIWESPSKPLAKPSTITESPSKPTTSSSPVDNNRSSTSPSNYPKNMYGEPITPEQLKKSQEKLKAFQANLELTAAPQSPQEGTESSSRGGKTRRPPKSFRPGPSKKPVNDGGSGTQGGDDSGGSKAIHDIERHFSNFWSTATITTVYLVLSFMIYLIKELPALNPWQQYFTALTKEQTEAILRIQPATFDTDMRNSDLQEEMEKDLLHEKNIAESTENDNENNSNDLGDPKIVKVNENSQFEDV